MERCSWHSQLCDDFPKKHGDATSQERKDLHNLYSNDSGMMRYDKEAMERRLWHSQLCDNFPKKHGI